MISNKYFTLSSVAEKTAKKLKGPILILGAGGFVGSNLLYSLLMIRRDVFGVSRDIKNNWRFKELSIPQNNLLQYDIRFKEDREKMISKVKPRTIFNLAAYGAYAKQKDILEIYNTNFTTTIQLIEELKKYGFDAYIHAGSSSEYGLNSDRPREIRSSLFPNSHYAISKLGVAHTLFYYGKIEELPVMHLRLYSVYGPCEEPDRLIANSIRHGLVKKFPSLSHASISRDFIYTSDVSAAFVIAAAKMSKNLYGEVFNIGTGKKTTIKKLAFLIKRLCKIDASPQFGSSERKHWDHGKDWYANIQKIQRYLSWSPKVTLTEGLQLVIDWQKSKEQVL